MHCSEGEELERLCVEGQRKMSQSCLPYQNVVYLPPGYVRFWIRISPFPNYCYVMLTLPFQLQGLLSVCSVPIWDNSMDGEEYYQLNKQPYLVYRAECDGKLPVGRRLSFFFPWRERWVSNCMRNHAICEIVQTIRCDTLQKEWGEHSKVERNG